MAIPLHEPRALGIQGSQALTPGSEHGDRTASCPQAGSKKRRQGTGPNDQQAIRLHLRCFHFRPPKILSP